MSMKRDYHIGPHGDGWAVTREGIPAPGSVHATKHEALTDGGECAKRDKVDLVVHRKDGRIRRGRQVRP